MPKDAARSLAFALDAFLSEHRRCSRLYGEGLENGEDGAVVWVECAGCTAVLLLAKG